MSQDLLAEFGSALINEERKGDLSFGALNNATSSHIPNSSWNHVPIAEDNWGEEEDDDFGDFEVAEQTPKEPVSRRIEPTGSRNVLETSPAMPSGFDQQAKTSRAPKKILSDSHPFASSPDVLFDADDLGPTEDVFDPGTEKTEDDDDFGEFETTEGAATVKPALPVSNPRRSEQHTLHPSNFDLLGLEDELPALGPEPEQTSIATSKTSLQVSRGEAWRNPRKHAAEIRQEPAPASQDDDFAEWDDFETTPTPRAATLPTVGQEKTKPGPGPESPASSSPIQLPAETIGNLLSLAPSTPQPAPSNIPPPSLLLTLFPSVLRAVSKEVLHPLSTLAQEQKHSFLASPPAHAFIRNYLTLTHVLGRIIAGRKNRWKRDKHLAQSMRIGPSVSGRSGGMKLAGLDGNESRREDAEVEDVLRVWREQVGRLKSAVTAATAAASGAKGKLPLVPELGSTMPVRISKGTEGGIVSTSACALCGLKREERVVKVDVAIEDSFGEWWVEGTNMHLACFNFWETFKGRLQAR